MTALQAIPPSRREVAVEEVRRAIILGQLAPGQKLREVALAAEVGVSRPTLREALMQLTHEGLCVHEPHRGFSVAQLDPEAIRNLTDTRLLLDQLAATSISADRARIDALRVAFDAYRQSARSEDPIEQHLAHVEFHRSMWAASRNDTLQRLWPTIESLATLVLAQDQVMRSDPARAIALHGAIVTAITSGTADEIRDALQAHTRQSAEEFILSRG